MEDQIDMLQAELRGLQAQGQDHWPLDQALARLDAIRLASPARAVLGRRIGQLARARLAAGAAAMRYALLLATGGGAALLALMAHLLNAGDFEPTEALVEGLGNALSCFGAALVLVALAAGLRQRALAREEKALAAELRGDGAGAGRAARSARRCRVLCTALLFATLAMFLAAGSQTYAALAAQARAQVDEDAGDGAAPAQQDQDTDADRDGTSARAGQGAQQIL